MVSNKVLTLAFVRESTRVLLGLKKRGFGEGRWNGFGGKVQLGETIEAGAVRYAYWVYSYKPLFGSIVVCDCNRYLSYGPVRNDWI